MLYDQNDKPIEFSLFCQENGLSITRRCKQTFFLDLDLSSKVTLFRMENSPIFKLQGQIAASQPSKFIEKNFNLRSKGEEYQVKISYASQEQTAIRIQTVNNYFVDVSWARFVGKSKADSSGKSQEGAYVLSLDSQFPQKQRFTNLRYTEMEKHFSIIADVYERNYGSFEIRIPKNGSSDFDERFCLEFYHNLNPIETKILHGEKLAQWHNINTELFVLYSSMIKNNREFYTDSNGLFMVRRIYGEDTRYN